jgi:uridine kinase
MDLVRKLIFQNPPKNGKFYLVAVDGRGGSGKTTLSNLLLAVLPEFVLLHGDDYFEPANNGIAWGYFNDKRFVKDVVKPLEAGKGFTYRPYDWHTDPHTSNQQITVEHGLILERGYSFDFPLNWDLKIWVETPREVCLERGLEREHMEIERSKKAWEVWQKAEDDYVHRFRPQETADLVLDGAKPFSEQLGRQG